MSNNRRILFFTDLHLPYGHIDTFKFLTKLQNVFKFDRVICGGDEVDNHCISFHDTDPDTQFSASSELETAINQFSCLFDIFPGMDIVDSNHGSLVYRRQKHHGLPRQVFKDWNEVLKAPPTYKWHDDLYLDMSNGQRLYVHHSRSKNPMKVSQQTGMCVLHGHHHGQFGINWWTSGEKWFWAASGGCLIDKDSLAMAYGRNNLPQPILGAIVILDGDPIAVRMELDENNRWTGNIKVNP